VSVRRVLVLLILIATLGAGAQEPPPSAVLTAYYDALARGDFAAAVRLLTGAGRPLAAVDRMTALVADTDIFGDRLQGKQAPSARCIQNLKNLGTTLEMYSTDNLARYPRTLAPLAPDYLRTLPTCPAAGADTYSTAFQTSAKADAYTIMCGGAHHAPEGYSANCPQYTSNEGLVNAEPSGPPAARPAAPLWKVAGAAVLSEKIEGDRALVEVDETYDLHGFPCHVMARYELVRGGLGWRIDAAALHGGFVGLEADDRVMWLRTHGVGQALLALYVVKR